MYTPCGEVLDLARLSNGPLFMRDHNRPFPLSHVEWTQLVRREAHRFMNANRVVNVCEETRAIYKISPGGIIVMSDGVASPHNAVSGRCTWCIRFTVSRNGNTFGANFLWPLDAQDARSAFRRLAHDPAMQESSIFDYGPPEPTMTAYDMAREEGAVRVAHLLRWQDRIFVSCVRPNPTTLPRTLQARRALPSLARGGGAVVVERPHGRSSAKTTRASQPTTTLSDLPTDILRVIWTAVANSAMDDGALRHLADVRRTSRQAGGLVEEAVAARVRALLECAYAVRVSTTVAHCQRFRDEAVVRDDVDGFDLLAVWAVVHSRYEAREHDDGLAAASSSVPLPSRVFGCVTDSELYRTYLRLRARLLPTHRAPRWREIVGGSPPPEPHCTLMHKTVGRAASHAQRDAVRPRHVHPLGALGQGALHAVARVVRVIGK